MCTNPSSFFTTVSFAAARFYCFLWEKPPTLYYSYMLCTQLLLVLVSTYFKLLATVALLSLVLHMYTPGALDEIWTGCPVITFQAFADLTGMNN